MPCKSFIVTLLSDVSITADAATVGGHSGLDYLPGSLFLGAAAVEARRRGIPFSPDLFLSGKVRFLDALPLIDGERGFAIPLCYHRKKGESWEGKEPVNLLSDLPDGQAKQWRRGYMNTRGEVLEIGLESRMKTAIDRNFRRSKESQLFGYESIPEGTRFLMSVQADDDKKLEEAVSYLSRDTLRLGRSRSAEYGAVRIEEAPLPGETVQTEDTSEDIIYIQLMSDTALEENGMPVLIPSPSHFGLENAALLPEKTFLRSRRYSPWNAFHNCRMTERQVLCKGGIIAFRTKPQTDLANLRQRLSAGVGLCREEGLGQVLVNPAWLFTSPRLKKYIPAGKVTNVKNPSTLLSDYLKTKTEERQYSYEAFTVGVKWAKEWTRLTANLKKQGRSVPAKAQWGTIRELALRSRGSVRDLLDRLEEFCTRDLRGRIWTETVSFGGKKASMYGTMREDVEFQGRTSPRMACLALFHASVEMARIMSRNDREGKEVSGI